MSADVRVIAFYLPQFHPIPENDRWWGRGLYRVDERHARATDVPRATTSRGGPASWATTTCACRKSGTGRRSWPASTASTGSATTTTGSPGAATRAAARPHAGGSGSRIFPSVICWANESWSRRWDGSEQDILMEQEYGPDDPARFISDVAPYAARPALHHASTARRSCSSIVPRIIPDVRERAAHLASDGRRSRDLASLHLCAVQSYGYTSGLEDGFDAMVEFPPHSIAVGEITRTDAGRRFGLQGQDLFLRRRRPVLPPR